MLLAVISLANSRDDSNFCVSSDTRKASLEAHKKKKLGEGSFGKVYGSENAAIKTMEVKPDKIKSFKKLMNREIANLLTFEDVNISKVYSQGCWTSLSSFRWIIQLKLWRYSLDMNEYFKTTRGTVTKIDIIFKLLSSVDKLHNEKVCHFDLKEGNIFMMNKYTPVLGDLGLTQPIKVAKDEYFNGGTPLYLGKNVYN